MVPKYCTAIFVKNSEHQDRYALIHLAIKSLAAGLAVAALTNTLDVICNEIFKTNLGRLDAVALLYVN